MQDLTHVTASTNQMLASQENTVSLIINYHERFTPVYRTLEDIVTKVNHLSDRLTQFLSTPGEPIVEYCKIVDATKGVQFSGEVFVSSSLVASETDLFMSCIWWNSSRRIGSQNS